MPTSGLAIITRGMVYPPDEIIVVVDESPLVSAVVEVRPVIRATVPPETEGAVGTPTVIQAEKLVPEIRSSQGPQVEGGQDEPTVIEATELRPQITRVEEE